jgi:hypothetical protein
MAINVDGFHANHDVNLFVVQVFWERPKTK